MVFFGINCPQDFLEIGKLQFSEIRVPHTNFSEIRNPLVNFISEITNSDISELGFFSGISFL